MSISHDEYQRLLDCDRQPVPGAMRLRGSTDFGSDPISRDRFVSREYHELEKRYLWPRVWQVACREEDLPRVGDRVRYDIADLSIMLVRTAPGADGIVAFENSCPHRGRLLCDRPDSVDQLRCPFHGFSWSLDGELRHVPTAWDFPQVTPEAFRLARLPIGTWCGFVFVCPDPDSQDLDSFLGELPQLFAPWDLAERYTKARVEKVMPANWKVAQEAFMEALHIPATHPQAALSMDPSRTEVEWFGNVARAIVPTGVTSEVFAGRLSEQDKLDAILDRRLDESPVWTIDGTTTAREAAADLARRNLPRGDGEWMAGVSDAELVDSIYFTVFPNFHPWGAFNEISYRFRPHCDDHTTSLFEVSLLAPFDGERPPPAPLRQLGVDDSWLDAPELGYLARVLDQDENNIRANQRGLLAGRRRPNTLSLRQEGKIRHFHHLLDEWIPEHDR
jgi:phenylpropionate dioxygenase-like ring-hydroxylating dioxygenase large terminal subunit